VLLHSDGPSTKYRWGLDPALDDETLLCRLGLGFRAYMRKLDLMQQMSALYGSSSDDESNHGHSDVDAMQIPEQEAPLSLDTLSAGETTEAADSASYVQVTSGKHMHNCA